MFRLMLMLFGFLNSSLFTPEPDDEPDEDKPDEAEDEPYRTLEFKTKEEADAHYNEVYKDRDKRLREEVREEEREKAEADVKKQAAKEKEDYKSLYQEAEEDREKQAKKVADLEAEVERLSGEVEAMTPHRENNEKRAEELLKNVPDSIRTLLEGRDPLDQLKWLDENPDYAKTEERGPNGSRPSPRPTREPRRDKDEDEQVRRGNEQAARARF